MSKYKCSTLYRVSQIVRNPFSPFTHNGFIKLQTGSFLPTSIEIRTCQESIIFSEFGSTTPRCVMEIPKLSHSSIKILGSSRRYSGIKQVKSGIYSGIQKTMECFCFAGIRNLQNSFLHMYPEADFKEFERRFKFKPRLKYDWFHSKLYSIF